MSRKVAPARDAFTFSLHGMTTIASFSPSFAIADDRLNRRIRERSLARPENTAAESEDTCAPGEPEECLTGA